MKHRISIPADYPRNPATFAGLPRISAGETVVLDLTDAQVASLKAHGVKVTRATAKKNEPEPENPSPSATENNEGGNDE